MKNIYVDIESLKHGYGRQEVAKKSMHVGLLLCKAVSGKRELELFSKFLGIHSLLSQWIQLQDKRTPAGPL